MTPRRNLEEDIRSQPDVLRSLIESGHQRWLPVLESLPPVLDRVIFTGMGSSYYAARGVASTLRGWGLDVTAEQASELLYHRHPLTPTTLVVAVSQSGESAELTRLAGEMAAEQTTMLAISTTEKSSLPSMVGRCLALETPPDHGVAIKSFGASLYTLLHLGSWLVRRPVGELQESALGATEAMTRVMGRAEEWVEHGRSLAGRFRAVTVIGRGPSLAAAGEAALLANEVSKVAAWSEDGAQFRHGIIEFCDTESLVWIVSPSGGTAHLQKALTNEVVGTGASVTFTATADGIVPGAHLIELPDVPESLASLLHILPYQWITLGWAEARNLEPGVFRYTPGVIRTETSP